jgi:hypothetical protein
MWPHNCGTYGVARAAQMRDSTALGLRSMVRMGPLVLRVRGGCQVEGVERLAPTPLVETRSSYPHADSLT